MGSLEPLHASARVLWHRGAVAAANLQRLDEVCIRADYQDDGDESDLDNNTVGYNDGNADDARKCKVGERQRGRCATTPCTGRSLNSNDGAFVMMSCSDSVESSAVEGIL